MDDATAMGAGSVIEEGDGTRAGSESDEDHVSSDEDHVSSDEAIGTGRISTRLEVCV
jgi:hypothetical protein